MDMVSRLGATLRTILDHQRDPYVHCSGPLNRAYIDSSSDGYSQPSNYVPARGRRQACLLQLGNSAREILASRKFTKASEQRVGGFQKYEGDEYRATNTILLVLGNP